MILPIHKKEIAETIEYENGTAIKFENGIMIYSTYIECEANENYCLVDFPIPFVGKYSQIVLANTYWYSGTIIWSSSNRTFNNFRAYSLETKTGIKPATKSSAFCIAIGKWK